MSLNENCLDPSGRIVRNGMPYYTAPSSCKKCICTNGEPDECKEEMCPTPQNCTTFRKGENCCDFVCLDEKPLSRSFFGVEYAYLGPRIVFGLIAIVVFGTFIFFILQRLRKCKLRGVSGIRQSRQLSEDGRSLGSIGYITGSLGYLPSAMDRFEEPNAHFPHYPLWKPPSNYFPRGEAPPPYEEAVAAALSGHSHIHIHASAAGPFSRDAGHLSISYNNYAANNLLGSGGHRTIPMNLATGANFNLQPERYDDCIATIQPAPINSGTTRSIGSSSVGATSNNCVGSTATATSTPNPNHTPNSDVNVDDTRRLSQGRPWDLPLSLSLPLNHHYHRHSLNHQLSQTLQHLTPGSGEERTATATVSSGEHGSTTSLSAQHHVDNCGSYTATLRRGKRPTVNHNGLSSTGPRRTPLAIMTPTPPPLPALSQTIQLPSHCRCPSRNLCICNNNHGVHGVPGNGSGASASTVSPSSGVSPNKTVSTSTSANQPLASLSLSQSALDDNDDYRSECENCKSTHSSNYYLDEEDPEPEITMTLHRKPTETGDELNYRTSLTLPTRHRMIPLHGTAPSCGARENWFNSMPESSTEESEDEDEDEEEEEEEEEDDEEQEDDKED